MGEGGGVCFFRGGGAGRGGTREAGEAGGDEGGEVETVVHITRLLKLASFHVDRPIPQDGAIVGSSCPPDPVVRVETDSLLPLSHG